VPYRLIALDLDGTLLTRQKVISARTRAALDEAVRRGCHLVIATGRSFPVARHFCTGITLTAPQITYNGAVIYDPVGERDLEEYLVPPECVGPGLRFFLDAGAHVALFTPQALYLDEGMPNPETWAPGSPIRPRLVADVTVFAGEPCIKIAGNADGETIARLRPLAHARFDEALYVTQTATTLLELLNPTVSKGAALERIAQMLGVARADVVAFGDSHNDLGMITYAGVGVAMENGSAEIKAAADMVTGSNEDDGIARALERLHAI
jgi:Cof subfamily protein (haloacid dehalogenase superfamily)